MARVLTVEEFSNKVISLGGSVVEYFVDNTGLTSERVKEFYNNDSSEFKDVVYYIYRQKKLPSDSYELVCDWIQDSLREAHATIPYSEIPVDEKEKEEIFNYIYNDCLKKLIAWATKEVRACEGGKLLKPQLLKTQEEIEKKKEENEINIDTFDAKVIGDIVISKSEDIIDYFSQKTGITHDLILDSFYNTEDKKVYKRIGYIRNFEDSEGERREVVQRWIYKIMNDISFGEDSLPEDCAKELNQYFYDYAVGKINEWIENEYTQCVEKEIELEEVNIDVIESTETEQPLETEEPVEEESKEPTANKKGIFDKISEIVSDKFVEKSVSEITKQPFVYETAEGRKVFINPKNVVLVEEETIENEEEEFIRVSLDTGKEVVIHCSFYSFMEDFSKK